MSISKKLDTIANLEQKLSIKKTLLLEKAITGEDPNDIIKASGIINSLKTREDTERKSYLIDPFDFVNNLGYKDRSVQLSYGVLARMAKTPIINAIIKTRINQIAAFAEPQKDRYNTGFIIRKKRNFSDNSNLNKLSKSDQNKIGLITEFILNCGRSQSWSNDDFDTFLRKIVRDSLVYDQMTFEVVRDRKGLPYEFVATDASTFRLADSIDDQEYRGDKKDIKGYYPSYVQIRDGIVMSEFYEWELCFGVRNPVSDIMNYGYGVSELEDLIQTVTAMLWSDEYNRRLFSQGSMPKGIIKVSGQVSTAKLQEFKQQWQSMIAGVYNSHKTPIMEAEKMEFVNLSQSSKDMEFGKWQDYLIKTACSIFCISPEEINFAQGGSSDNKAMFESNNEGKLKHSKDRGLYPLLKFIQQRINKYIVSQIDPSFEFVFVGMDSMTPVEEADLITKRVSTYMTLNEVRQEAGLKPLEDGDTVLNSVYQQVKMQKQQKEMMEQQQVQGGFGVEDDMSGDDQGNDEGDQNTDENPFE